MGIPQQQYHETQARELQEWIQERPIEGKIDHIQTDAEKEQMRIIETAMTAVGMLATGILFTLIFALIAYWISPWAVVSIICLAVLIGLWTH